MGRVLVFLGLFFSSISFAYTPTLTVDGKPVRWSGNPHLYVAGNPRNQNGLSTDDFFQSVVRGLRRWESASAGRITFDYWQGTDSKIYLPNSEYNGLSSVYFSSNSSDGSPLSSNVLGLTQVWYNTDTGEILETDVVLNDQAYRFTTDPRDTSGYGSSLHTSPTGARNVFIDNVVTHELGHAVGLSHSGGLQSTMLFMESPEQAYLGCDEQVGIRALYPSGDAGSRGSIRGQVTGNGAPVFGAHVLAVSRNRGVVLATGLTDMMGRYNIDALEPGPYFLMVEPFFAGAKSLPKYYAGIDGRICGGRNFSRTPVLDQQNLMKTVEVRAGVAADSSMQVKCDGTGAAVPSSGSQLASAALFDARGVSTPTGFGAVDRFSGSDTLSYRLDNVSGRLEIHALAYSLYSPVHVTLSLLDDRGGNVSAEVTDPAYEGSSGFVNYDSSLVAENLEPGTYWVHVSSRSLNSSVYPTGPASVDPTPFVVVTGSLNGSSPALSSALPVNARCRMNENFAAYSSPPGLPPRKNVDSGGDGTGACGTLAEIKGPGGDGGSPSGPSAGAVAGWFFPWLAMTLLARAVRRFPVPVR